MKFNTPLPQSLPKECAKASRIFQSFVDSRNQGLDGVIPRSVLENAKGFAIFSVFKAGFLFSARAGSGIVVAKLLDGTWSAPSAIGTAGMGFGGQAGAEVTDFLVVLNSRSAVKSFMAAGSLTLGGNMSIALGPLGRNGEASSSLNTNGNIAAMYSYSKTKGLFGGVSIEGSVIVERQDANALAYGSTVTAKMLLTGVVSPPNWANELTRTLEKCTGLPGGHEWIQDAPAGGLHQTYAFGGMSSPQKERKGGRRSKSLSTFPPPSWGKQKDTGSYFDSLDEGLSSPVLRSANKPSLLTNDVGSNASDIVSFPVHFESDLEGFDPKTRYSASGDMNQPRSFADRRSQHPVSSKSLSIPSSIHSSNPFLLSESSPLKPPSDFSDSVLPQPQSFSTSRYSSTHLLRAVAEYDFEAVEPGDLGFSKGDVIVITEKSDKIDDWWTGFIGGREGIFPANFVRLL